MNPEEFSRIRVYLKKTQRQLAALLGASVKAVQSFEQGWRNIPPHAERQMLFLLAAAAPESSEKFCWQTRKCTGAMKRQCPAFEFHQGRRCWFINGTFCRGKAAANWPDKMAECRKCPFFLSVMPEGVLLSRP
ncbi:MAG: transcriptional regulator [Desulfobacterales bacterium]|nr:transcriptional regulator [Desulfobacterales bacterium]